MENKTPSSDPFTCLGHDHGTYYYLPRSGGQVVELTADQHSEKNFLRLAPAQYWEQAYPSQNGANFKMAVNSLIQHSHTVGIYDPSRVRGRGAWWDTDKAVLHLGDRLIVEGKEVPLLSGKYVYEAAAPFPVAHQNPLKVSEAAALAGIADMISWEKKISALYLSGWCVIAPICGALNWRPHIWITGAAGSGKSTVFDKIIRRLLGDIAIATQSATTEAGLRQSLRHDARPVVFDEIESVDPRAQVRIQNILELARQASSETGARIIKGSATGDAVSFAVRSCFAFLSISYGVTNRADASRVSVLGIKLVHDQPKYERLLAMIARTFTDEYVSRFVARSIKMIPVIRENARIFATAVSSELSNQRAGDQIGALLAGAYSLTSDGIITPERAKEFIGQQDWSEQKGINEDTDEQKCFSMLMQHSIRVSPKSGACDRTIAELLNIASERGVDDIVLPGVADDALGRIGFKAGKDMITVSTTHNAIAGILKDTQWSKNWGSILKRIKGAHETNGTVRFKAVKSRGIEIPYQDDEVEEVLA